MLTRFFDLNDTFSLMDAFERQVANAFQDAPRAFGRAAPSSNAPSLHDDGDKLTFVAALPGFAKNSIDVSLEGDVLTVKAERKLEVPKDAKVVRRERESYQFLKQFELGVPVQADAVEAAFADGILTVTLPKAPEAKPRKIQISGGEESRRALGSA